MLASAQPPSWTPAPFCVLNPSHPPAARAPPPTRLAGKVLVNGRPVVKAGTPVADPSSVVITAEQPKYVCRAGLKLEAALAHWGIDVRGKAALDSGLSTGGFADCLLQHGAASVVGVDVGYGQVREAWGRR